MTIPENTPKLSPLPDPKATEPQIPSVSKRALYVRWGLVIGIILLALLGGLYLFKKTTTRQAINQIPQITQPLVAPSVQPTKPRSKAPGIVLAVTTAKSIDPKTGEAVNPTTIFLTTDKSIYAVATLQNAKVGTQIEYVRYLNSKFLDNRSITITKPGTNNISFVWSLIKPGAKHVVGTYGVKIYTNGIFEKEISYTVN